MTYNSSGLTNLHLRKQVPLFQILSCTWGTVPQCFAVNLPSGVLCLWILKWVADGLFLKSLTVSGFVVKRKITVGGYSLCLYMLYVFCCLWQTGRSFWACLVGSFLWRHPKSLTLYICVLSVDVLKYVSKKYDDFSDTPYDGFSSYKPATFSTLCFDEGSYLMCLCVRKTKRFKM